MGYEAIEFHHSDDRVATITLNRRAVFDPHVTYGMTSAIEPIGLRLRIPRGEALRWGWQPS